MITWAPKVQKYIVKTLHCIVIKRRKCKFRENKANNQLTNNNQQFKFQYHKSPQQSTTA